MVELDYEEKFAFECLMPLISWCFAWEIIRVMHRLCADLKIVMLLMCSLSVSHFVSVVDDKLQVVKNVASQSLEVKKLVYLYLLHYAEKYVHAVSL